MGYKAQEYFVVNFLPDYVEKLKDYDEYYLKANADELIDKYYDVISENQFDFSSVAHGFIFKDGSVLDISSGRDHREIPESEWLADNIVTYHIDNDLIIRINGKVSQQQLREIKSIFKDFGLKHIICDVYNSQDKLVKTIDVVSYMDFINELYDINKEENIFEGLKISSRTSVLKILNFLTEELI